MRFFYCGSLLSLMISQAWSYDYDPRLASNNIWELPLESLVAMPVSSVATGTETPIDKSASTVTVITAKEISDMGATDLDQALALVPGLFISRSSQAYFPKYVFRGLTSSYNPEALLLVNGIAKKSLFTGNRGHLTTSFPVKSIKRIEVIRGPGSALYGADAFAGVINIITVPPKELKNEAGVRVGTFDTVGGWVSHAALLGDMNTGLTLEYQQTNGQHKIVTEDAQSGFDPLFGTHASLAPGEVRQGHNDVDLNLTAQKGSWQYRLGFQDRNDIGSVVGIAQSLDPRSLFHGSQLTTDLTFGEDNWRPNWDIKLQWSYFYNLQDNTRNTLLFPAGAFAGTFPEGMTGNPEYKEEQARFDWHMAFNGFDNRIVRFGTGYFWGDVYEVAEHKNFYLPPGGLPVLIPFTDVSDTDNVFLHENQRTSWYAYAQDEWRFARQWALTTGVRFDQYSDFGNTVNPRLALVKVWSPQLSTKLLYGRAFHAPSFIDLYSTDNPVSIGNADLKPAIMNNYELVLAHQPSPRFNYNLGVYRYDVRDVIEYVNAIATNAGKHQGQGLEFDMTAQIARVKVSANYSYQHAEDSKSGEDLGEVPREMAYLRVICPLPYQWQWTNEVQWIGEQLRSSGDLREPVDASTVVNMSWQARGLWQSWDVSLNTRNLFNVDVRIASPGAFPAMVNDYPLTGRSVTAEVTKHW